MAFACDVRRRRLLEALHVHFRTTRLGRGERDLVDGAGGKRPTPMGKVPVEERRQLSGACVSDPHCMLLFADAVVKRDEAAVSGPVCRQSQVRLEVRGEFQG